MIVLFAEAIGGGCLYKKLRYARSAGRSILHIVYVKIYKKKRGALK